MTEPGQATSSPEWDPQHLAQSRADIAALLAAVPDLWFLIDRELRYVDVSNPEHPALSAPWPSKRGRPLEDVLAPADADTVRRLIAAAHASGQPQSYTYVMATRSGELRRFEGRCVPMSDGRTLKLVRDITEVAELEQRFHAMADAAPVGIFMTDPEGGCTYANAAWQQLYGLTAENAHGQGWAGVLHPDDRAAVHHHWLACAAARQPFEMEFRLLLGDGTLRTVSSRSNPIVRVDGSIGGHVGTVVDVTQARQLEDARRAQAVAEETGRRQAAFMSRVSHELRTPLNAILGFGQLLQQGGEQLPAARARAFVGHVVQAGQHMLALVDDLLELQRLEQGRVAVHKRPVRLQALLTACAQLLEPVGGADTELQVACAPELELDSDERCLRQLLLNLGSNAVKYGRPPQGRGRVVLAAERCDGAVLLRVSDSGAGIAPEQLARLFQPFERLGHDSGTTPGSGLGLVITRHLARLLGGDVALASEPGRGTTATVRLPA